ncbi:MAG: stage II sporulation protein R [Acutalibacteraceae bacterium]
MTLFTYKTLNERKDKILLSVVAIAISLYIAFSCTYFTASAQTVKDDVVRLHILANSNSEVDQEVKLKVRDALLETNTAILEKGVTTENAQMYFEESKNELLDIAEKTLKKNGLDYSVKITLGTEYFETRKYGDLTFPAGHYTSLKVILGEGKGKNWWCVMFPPLCVPAAEEVQADKEKTADYLSESGEKVINGGNKYVVKFKFLEIYEELRSKLGAEK